MTESDSEPVKKSLKNLLLSLRERQPVESSLGTLYARHISIGDLSALSALLEVPNPDLSAVGRATLLRLISKTAEGEDESILTEDEIGSLTAADLLALGQAVMKATNLPPLNEGDGLLAIGKAVQTHVREAAESNARMTASFKRSFPSIGEQTRSMLQRDLSGLGAITESLRGTSALESLRHTEKIGDMYRRMKEAVGPLNASELAGISALKNAVKTTDPILESLRTEEVFNPSHLRGSPSIDVTIPHLRLPDPENTPLGRAATATEQTAQQVTEVAGLLAAMGAQLGELSQTIVTKAVPEWMSKLEGDRESAKTTLEQARDSLKWTKWAVMASVVITLATTGWQVWIAREYKIDNDRQQAVSERLLREQLETAQQSQKNLMAEAIRLREAISATRAVTSNALVRQKPQ